MRNDLIGYLEEIARVDLLSIEEERELARIIRNGVRAQNDRYNAREKNLFVRIDEEAIKAGQEARQNLIEPNLRLVVSIAKRFAKYSNSLTLADLIEEGNLGLLRAAKKFDGRPSNKFSTYATWWIRQFIQNALDNQDRIIRNPIHRVREVRKYQAINGRLSAEFGREPLAREIAFEMKLGTENLSHIKSIIINVFSMEASGDQDNDEYVFEDKKELPPYGIDAKSCLKEGFRILSKREQRVLTLRYGLPDGVTYTLEQVADLLKITRERVRQIQRGAVRKLGNSRLIKELR